MKTANAMMRSTAKFTGIVTAGALLAALAAAGARAADNQGAGTPGDAAAQRPAAATAVCRQPFRIALDVGHTPEAKGALSARGANEYEFNVRLAEKIKTALTNAGYRDVGLIFAHGVGRAQLVERTAAANRLRANLLLSIHHDDVQSSYYKKWTDKGHVYNYSDNFSGYSIFLSKLNPFFTDGLRFATLLATELMARGMMFTSHHAEPIAGENRAMIDPARGIYQYDELFVLKNTQMPSVLLEAGVIVNRDEETALKSPERQDLIGAAVVAALQAWCPKPR
jgi:N-acetylmuramoyl-L-alanine amidase